MNLKILLVASLLCAVSAGCSGTITDCFGPFSSFTCSWYPTTEQCLDNCLLMNQAQCQAASPRCTLVEGAFCQPNDDLPCDSMALRGCTSNTACEVVVGNNTCQDCTKVTDASECGRIGCNWNRVNNSCSPLEDFCNFSNETFCNENSCLWTGAKCVPISGSYPVCASPGDKNCIINDANTTCENITSFAKCKQQGTCDWSTITNSCYETDICQRVERSEKSTSCIAAGCIQLPGICTAAPAFKNCAAINDRNACNNKKRCVSVTDDNNQTTCKPFLECDNIKNMDDCVSKPGCNFTSLGFCSQSESNVFVSFECGGKPCENLNKNPDITTYQISYLSAAEGISAADLIQTTASTYGYISKDSVPCVGCTFCETGFVPNLQAGFTCRKGGCTFSQQICIKAGEYPPEDRDWGVSTDSSSDLAAGIIVVIVFAAVVALCGAGGGVYKVTSSEKAEYEDIQGGS